MSLYRIDTPEQFDEVPEAAMGVHFAESRENHSSNWYIVIGGCVAIALHAGLAEPIGEYLGQKWLQTNVSIDQRESEFGEWLGHLPSAPQMQPRERPEFWHPVLLRRESQHDETATLAFIVSPLRPPPQPAAGPPPIYGYGHLPFGTRTAADTMVYRWEAFPKSRRITRGAQCVIAAGTYGAPASEVAFAPTGFSAVARFALPNLLPACFRWELQPPANEWIECGASVPLYGQSGGGVEVRFPKATINRCPVADPVFLPAM